MHSTKTQEPRAVVSEPRAVVSEPRAVVSEPRAVVSEPRSSLPFKLRSACEAVFDKMIMMVLMLMMAEFLLTTYPGIQGSCDRVSPTGCILRVTPSLSHCLLLILLRQPIP